MNRADKFICKVEEHSSKKALLASQGQLEAQADLFPSLLVFFWSLKDEHRVGSSRGSWADFSVKVLPKWFCLLGLMWSLIPPLFRDKRADSSLPCTSPDGIWVQAVTSKTAEEFNVASLQQPLPLLVLPTLATV